MMTRNIRKVISIICAVALILSLCVVSFTGTTSAFKLSDTPTGTALKLDFENGKGVADFNGTGNGFAADPKDSNNRVFKITTGIGGNSFNWMPGATADAELDTTNASTAFTLKPNTTYVISYKWMVAANANHNANTPSVTIYRAENSDKSGKVGTGAAASITLSADNCTGQVTNTAGVSAWVLPNDTEWMDYSVTMTTPASLGTNTRLAFVCANSCATYANTYYFDDFMIDEVNELEDLDETYVFNGREDGTTNYWTGHANSLFSTGSYVDAAGYHYVVDKFNSANSTGVAWRKCFAVYDPDLGYQQLEKDAKYVVTVKYKLEAVEGNTNNGANLAFAYSNNTTAPGGNQHQLGILKWGEKHKTPTDDWQYMSIVINGNDYQNRWLYLTGDCGNSTGAKVTFLVESITVDALRNSAGVVSVNYETNGGNPISPELALKGSLLSLPTATNADSNKIFAGWYLDPEFKNAAPANYTLTADLTLYAKWASEYVNITYVSDGKETTARLAPGTVLPRPERINARLFFLGWATDKGLTNIVTKAPDADCTLYAKYDYAYSGFNQGGWSDRSMSTIAQVVKDPDDANNNVLLMQGMEGRTDNFEFSVGDIAGAPAYELQLNTRYYISFKYKIAPTEDGGLITLYTGEQSAFSSDASKSTAGLALRWSEGSMKEGSDWITVTHYYETGDSFYKERVNWSVQNKLYLALCGVKDGKNNGAAVAIYIDDLYVGPVTDKVPEGATAVYFNTNAGDMSPVYGYPGEKMILPEDPTLSAHKFVGWYTDKNFQNKFTATTFGTSDITLYARWELTDWIMDFEHEYGTGGKSDRYTFITENGNTYMRYNYEDGQKSSTADHTAYGRTTYNRGSNDPYLVYDGVSYTISFKYKVVEVTGDNPKFMGITSQKFATWTDGKGQGGSLDLGGPSTEWKTAEHTVVPTGMAKNANHFGLGVNGDATVLFDDFKITAEIDMANIYGSTVITFNSNGGSVVDPIGGNPGEPIVLPKNPTRAGYLFKGWYHDSTGANKFEETVYGEDNIQLVAIWALARFTENFEELPLTFQTQGLSGAYVYYNSTVEGYDKANVQSGTTSIFRKGDVTGTRSFAVCRDASMTLDVGSQYTLTVYVKPANVGDAAGTISLIGMSANTAISAPDSTEVIATVGELKTGEWQKITYTFTAKEQYIGISTTAGNDIYFDSVYVNMVGYTGTDTGDSSVSPIIIAMMVVLAAGALIITGKKVFAK